MRVDHILAELHKEREEVQLKLNAVSEAILTFERLRNGGRKPRGRPKGSTQKVALARRQAVQQISNASF